MKVHRLVVLILVLAFLSGACGRKDEIFKAARNGNLEKVKQLTQGNQELVNQKDKKHQAPLIVWAAFGGHKDVVEYLINTGADVNAIDKYGDTALNVACKRRYWDVAEFLLGIENVDVKKADKEDNNPPIIWSITHNNPKTSRLLLEAGAEINVVNRLNRTPLFFAALRGYEEMTRYALSKGLDANLKDKYEVTPIQAAVYGGHLNILKLFYEMGANLQMRTYSGGTLLHSAAARGHNDIVAYLLESGLDSGIKDKNGDTAADYARWQGNDAIARQLEEAIPNVETLKKQKTIQTQIVDSKKSMETIKNNNQQPIKITFLVDHIPGEDSDLKCAWGLCALVEGPSWCILFDTGPRGRALKYNIKKLGVDLSHLQAIILSHDHHDHNSGMAVVLKRKNNIPVYLPYAVSIDTASLIEHKGGKAIFLKAPLKLTEGLWLSGQMGTFIKEQALVMETQNGLVILTGCAHPGIADMVRQIKNHFNKDIYMVCGGFHMVEMEEDRITTIIEAFREMGVKKVAAGHCTGKEAVKMFQEAYKDDFTNICTGKQLIIPTAKL